MFGKRYWGNVYFGPRYFGNGSDTEAEQPNVVNHRIIMVAARSATVDISTRADIEVR